MKTIRKEWVTKEYYGKNYRVSNYGDVISLVSGKLLKQRLHKDGYLIVTLGKDKNRRGRLVHILVAENFIEKPNDADKVKYEVNHKDLNRQNPRVDNLEWVTHRDNILHSIRLGSYDGKQVGENNNRAIYTEDEVLKIRKLYDGGLGVMDIIRKIHPDLDTYKERLSKWSTVDYICKRKSWKHI